MIFRGRWRTSRGAIFASWVQWKLIKENIFISGVKIENTQKPYDFKVSYVLIKVLVGQNVLALILVDLIFRWL